MAETNRNAFRRVRTRTSFEVRDLPFLRAVWFASRHGALFRPVSIPHACQGVCETSVRLDTGSVFRFRTAVASDRLLPPTTYPIANPRSRFSSRVLACAIPEMRSLTFHDVQARFGRIDASRRGLSPRDSVPACFEKAKYVSILASGTCVAPLCLSRRPLRRSTSFTPRPRLAYCRHPVKDVDCVTSRSAFLRSSLLELSSWSSIPVAHHPEDLSSA
jgi:hypothetical protein